MKSFKAKDGSSDPPGPGRNGERDFRGEKRGNATNASSTDPEAQLYRKGQGKEAKLSFLGHALMENRSELIVAASVTKATGTAERKAAAEMIVRREFVVSPWVATRAMTQLRPWPTCARSTSPRTSHRTPPDGVPPSTAAHSHMADRGHGREQNASLPAWLWAALANLQSARSSLADMITTGFTAPSDAYLLAAS
jgi:hypothetical protein